MCGRRWSAFCARCAALMYAPVPVARTTVRGCPSSRSLALWRETNIRLLRPMLIPLQDCFLDIGGSHWSARSVLLEAWIDLRQTLLERELGEQLRPMYPAISTLGGLCRLRSQTSRGVGALLASPLKPAPGCACSLPTSKHCQTGLPTGHSLQWPPWRRMPPSCGGCPARSSRRSQAAPCCGCRTKTCTLGRTATMQRSVPGACAMCTRSCRACAA